MKMKTKNEPVQVTIFKLFVALHTIGNSNYETSSPYYYILVILSVLVIFRLHSIAVFILFATSQVITLFYSLPFSAGNSTLLISFFHLYFIFKYIQSFFDNRYLNEFLDKYSSEVDFHRTYKEGRASAGLEFTVILKK